MPLPTFVIAGAQKCGTTSLAATLRRHPEVFVSRIKELHFFDQNHEDGLASYADQFTPAPHHKAWGEGTPRYLYDADARRRMCDALPESRMIVMLRDPAKRAYSHYWHARRRGSEHRRTFEKGLAAEPDRLARRKYRNAYVDRGHYIDQLEALTAAHDPALLHVILFEDLIGDRTATLRGVFDFLGVDPGPASTIEEQWRNRHQVTTEDGTAVPASYPPMAAETRARLVDHFRPYNDRLSTWLGRDLSAWNEV